MRRLKILCLGIMLIFSIFLLSGCTHYFDYKDLKDNVSKIEIIKLIHRDNSGDAEFIIELSDEETEELLLALTKIEFNTIFGMALPYLGEYGIKIYDTNGNYQTICYSSSFRYDMNDTQISVKRWACSKEEFDNLIFEYIDSDFSS